MVKHACARACTIRISAAEALAIEIADDGAFTLTALVASTLAQAAAQANPVLLRPAQFIYFVEMAALMPFFYLIPDSRFQPAWLRWVAFALAADAALVAFELVGWGATGPRSLPLHGRQLHIRFPRWVQQPKSG